MINAIGMKFTLHGKDFFLGLMKAGDLVRNFKVDIWSTNNPNGYQRELSKSRSKKFADYLLKCSGIFHQTVLLNIRNSNKIEFDLKHNNLGSININDDFYIVDGQHRIQGLKFLLELQPSFEEMPIPVLIMNGFSRESEAKEFLIVNKTQKGVRADLSDRLLSHVISSMDKELLEIIGIREPKKITELIVDICDKLNKTRSGVWYKKITLPNQKTKKTETIKQRSMTESLKIVVKDTYIETNYKSVSKLAALLIDYWNAIKELCPKACGIGADAKDYVLLKTTGPFILHRLLPLVIIKCGQNPSASKMKSVLAKIEEMKDDYWHKNGELGEGSNQKFFARRFEDFKSQLE